MEVSDYLKAIVTPMLKHRDCITIIETQDPMGVLLTMTIHKEDMGIVIGKAGETAKAVRHIVRIAGLVGDSRVSVKITEPVKTG
jgi:uncharacterized protein